jgi:hypothetical protein
LTISGDDGTTDVETDDGGNWQDYMDPGSYTISDPETGDSVVVQVQAGETTFVLAVRFVPGPKGTLILQRFECERGVAGTSIEVNGGPANGSCLPSDASIEVDAASGEAEPLVVDLGSDGESSLEIAEGAYIVTDGPSGAETDVNVEAASSVSVVVNGPVLLGTIAASIRWCPASVLGVLNPDNASQWAESCPIAGAGLTVTLFDGDGNPIATSQTGSDGSISFEGLVPGTYGLQASNGCALFTGGVDARGGFSVAGGGVVNLMAFGCAAPVNNPPPDPGTIGGENPNGPPGIGDGDITDDLLNAAGFHTRNLQSNPVMSVSTLPSTGETEPGSNFLVGRGRKRFR